MSRIEKRKNINNDDPRRAALGQWVREQRMAKGYTMRDMAAKSGRPHSYFGKIEQAQRGLDLLEFIDMCEWLDVSPLKSFVSLQVVIKNY
ncbi:helix-turn-helix domain-containing protein [Alishewanella sp. HH-ZS]|uniref:helix-turn-helix domain-containing protein n=1 Tax=Alishewanella sp. HH-ZS TaxID=1856684 RepID=UPI0008236C51|nr:helix-turn-helix transcriptional regulator [Alishewanella sp. HH-ZS]OCW96199.1 transcriptional regulator [Alishewanella sp. HH-ZS]